MLNFRVKRLRGSATYSLLVSTAARLNDSITALLPVRQTELRVFLSIRQFWITLSYRSHRRPGRPRKFELSSQSSIGSEWFFVVSRPVCKWRFQLIAQGSYGLGWKSSPRIGRNLKRWGQFRRRRPTSRRHEKLLETICPRWRVLFWCPRTCSLS